MFATGRISMIVDRNLTGAAENSKFVGRGNVNMTASGKTIIYCLMLLKQK